MSGDSAGSTGGGGTTPLPPTPSREDLLALAAERHPRAPDWTRAGRALQKHGYRSTGSVYPRVTGPPARYNAVAQQIVETILRDSRSVVRLRSRRWYGTSVPFIEVIAVDGRKLGYAWDAALGRFRFDGFREP